MQHLDVYNVDLKYIRALSKADSKVMSQSPQIGKANRPYIGIIVLLNGKKYCIPLTSTKNKKDSNREVRNNLDYIKIPHPTKKNEHGAAITIGALNINNMIPVCDEVITKYDLSRKPNDEKSALQRKIICTKERDWCQIPENTELIIKRANIVYDIVTSNKEKNRSLVRRCCDFQKLEAVLDKYLEKNGYKKRSLYTKVVTKEQLAILEKSDIPYKKYVNGEKTAVKVEWSLKDKLDSLLKKKNTLKL